MKKRINVFRQDPIFHSRIHVGTISYDNSIYIFNYSDEYKSNSNNTPIFPFIDLSSEYTCPKLFPVFSSRLPDPKRADIKTILSKYGMEEYDEFTLLMKSRGRLPIDTLEFVPEISENEVDGLDTEVAGVSHYNACILFHDHIDLSKGDKLRLELNPENQFDKYAVKVLKADNLIGYIPKYYSQMIFETIKKNNNLYAVISNISEHNCTEAHSEQCRSCICIKIKISSNPTNIDNN